MWLLVVMITEFGSTERAVKCLQFLPVMEYTAPHAPHSVIVVVVVVFKYSGSRQ